MPSTSFLSGVHTQNVPPRSIAVQVNDHVMNCRIFSCFPYVVFVPIRVLNKNTFFRFQHYAEENEKKRT